MKFLSSEKLSQHKYKTPEGYLICTDAILARTGKQTYRKCEVFADAADDESEIEIDRKAEEVFAPETLASFENKPITVEHPDENVTPDNYNSLSVGFVRDVHRGTVNGQDVMLGTLVITDARTIEEIENGEHTDLSCGYDCDIIDETNPQQRNIRGNHVALCEQGRAGIARIVDSKSIKDYKLAKEISVGMSIKHNSVSNGYGIVKEIIKAKDKEGEYLIFNLDNGSTSYRPTDKVDVKDAQKRYAITPKRKWLSSKKLEQYFTNLDEAKYAKEASQKADRIDYVVVDTETMTVIDSIKDTPTPATSGRDVSKYTLQSTADKNLFFYIGEKYAMKEGSWTYQLYNLNDMTAEELLEELKKSGWKQVSNRRTVIDSCDTTDEKTFCNVEDAREVKAENLKKGDIVYVGYSHEHPQPVKCYVNKIIKRQGLLNIELFEASTGLYFKTSQVVPEATFTTDSVIDAQSKEISFKRLEDIPLKARQEMKNSSNKAATLLSIESNIEDIINAALPEYKSELRQMGDKIISDLKKQFTISDSVYSISYIEDGITYIKKIKAKDAHKAFIKFRNKQK